MSRDCHDTALSYLEHRERSAHEMRSHLRSKGFQEEEIEAELVWLSELHYIDDARYCGDYIRYGAGKGRGPVRLRHELSEKGLDAGLVRDALEEAFDRDSEKAAARREAEKLLKQHSAAGIFPQEGEGDEDEKDNEETAMTLISGSKQAAAPDEKLLAKIGRKLSSLGYHSEVIYDIVGQLRKDAKRIHARAAEEEMAE